MTTNPNLFMKKRFVERPPHLRHGDGSVSGWASGEDARVPGAQIGAVNEVLLLRAPWYRRHRPARPCVKFCCSPSGAVGRAALASCSPIPPPCTVSLPISWVKARKYMGAVTVSRSAVCKPQQGTDQEHLAVASPPDLVRAVVVQAAVLASFFVLSPVIAQANSCRPTSTDAATVEAQASSARSSQPKRVVRLATVLPMDALGDARVSNAAAQEMARICSDVPSKLEDLSLLEQAEGLSTERKNWLYSPQARKMGMLLVSAASFTVDLNMVDSALVAKAQEPAQQQEPLENAKAAISHATNAASELASGVSTQMGPNAQHFAAETQQYITDTAPKISARVSSLLSDTTAFFSSRSASADKAADKAEHVQGSFTPVAASVLVPQEVARKSWSVFRNPDAELAAEALEFVTPATSEDEMHKRYPSWQKITRKDLLQMEFHHHEVHEVATSTTHSIFSTLVAPLTMAFGFIKLMFPLTMLSVPIIWVFPWELITGGFKGGRKFFNDVPGSKKEENSANRFREDILWASTAFNVVVSVIFGSGGGGGGGH
eukprot:CAMPEP_0179439980 /NCGR_PEP_ID=MMETSP0799-20121207/23589_1 /TAXON_ID=46947 /ORGANISM="Geminigera cryophila, Strain CCMP2564" /LENGTH=545 /DNA_ID=CAMNT_0021222891 /DNA_START=100 /DNA_END=1739 /DNA_ORIENTATION=-